MKRSQGPNQILTQLRLHAKLCEISLQVITQLIFNFLMIILLGLNLVKTWGSIVH